MKYYYFAITLLLSSMAHAETYFIQLMKDGNIIQETIYEEPSSEERGSRPFRYIGWEKRTLVLDEHNQVAKFIVHGDYESPTIEYTPDGKYRYLTQVQFPKLLAVECTPELYQEWVAKYMHRIQNGKHSEVSQLEYAFEESQKKARELDQQIKWLERQRDEEVLKAATAREKALRYAPIIPVLHQDLHAVSGSAK